MLNAGPNPIARLTILLAGLTAIACAPIEVACQAGDVACQLEQTLLVGRVVGNTTTGLPNKIMFTSTTTTSGFMTGTAGADTICGGDASSKSLSGTYKAMIGAATGTMRTASVTANTGDGQVDWVLSASTNYVQEDGTTLISTTSANALLSFPLSSSIGGGSQYWSGLQFDWRSSANDCTDSGAQSWTFVGAGAGNGAAGDLTSTSSTFIASATPTCSTGGFHLICVEQ